MRLKSEKRMLAIAEFIYKLVLFTARGLKQGDGLAPTLFNIALEYVIRGLSINSSNPVSYTHLDVYKRQVLVCCFYDFCRPMYENVLISIFTHIIPVI